MAQLTRMTKADKKWLDKFMADLKAKKAAAAAAQQAATPPAKAKAKP